MNFDKPSAWENKPWKNKDEKISYIELLFHATKAAFSRLSKATDPEEIASWGRSLDMIETGAKNLIAKSEDAEEKQKWQKILDEIEIIKNKIKSN